MSFLHPTYLWALWGLAIPIAIHLWSKKEGKTIKVGSIKLLQSADSRQSSSIQLNEYVLLALRSLLIVFLILIIARPQLKKEAITQPLTYIVEPELLYQNSIESLLDSLQATAPVRVLQESFPEVNTYIPKNASIPNYWQLVQNMDHLATDSIVVFTRGLVQGVKGKRPKTYKKIAWVVMDIEDPVDQYIEAVQVEDSIQLLGLTSDAERLSFRKENVGLKHPDVKLNASVDSITISRTRLPGRQEQNKEQLPLQQAIPIEIGWVVDDTLMAQARYLEAAFRALGTYLRRPITTKRIENVSAIGSGTYDCLVWLSGQPVVAQEGKLLVYRSDTFTSKLIEKGSSNDVFYLTKMLNSENSIDEHLATQLLPLLELHSGLETRIKANDQRVVDKAGLFPRYEDAPSERSKMTIKDISPWLWSIVVILLIVERCLARYRKQ